MYGDENDKNIQYNNILCKVDAYDFDDENINIFLREKRIIICIRDQKTERYTYSILYSVCCVGVTQ